jgi:hypothetical protein
MDYRIQVSWNPGKQQLAADTLYWNPVWPGTLENSGKEDSDPGYEDTYFVANEYREEHVFKEELCDPMIEEMFSAAKEDKSYRRVLTEVNKGLTKDALKLLPPDHPARAMTQQWNKISVMERGDDSLMVYQGSRIVVPIKKIKEYLHLPHLGQKLTYQTGALCYWWPGGFREELFKLRQILSVQTAGT